MLASGVQVPSRLERRLLRRGSGPVRSVRERLRLSLKSASSAAGKIHSKWWSSGHCSSPISGMKNKACICMYAAELFGLASGSARKSDASSTTAQASTRYSTGLVQQG